MTTHTYSLRSRVSSSSLSTKTPTHSPLSKPRSPRKAPSSSSTLQLKHVIGTTTSTPSGFSCCSATESYAYCAGSVAVLASIGSNDEVTYRYFKARPTVVPVNQITSYYDSPLTSNTPTRRRTILNTRRASEDHLGSLFGREWPDEGGGATWSARERIKAASCVAISADGKILAVGEIGYNPRVLLFSTAATASSDQPLSIMTDHTIGIRCVAFSPNSKYLATLGDVNDGFLYIWRINTRTGVVKLHSSNKCTTNVCDMTWCGNCVVTVGTRHIKVWHASDLDNSSSKRKSYLRREGETSKLSPIPLQGRNCLLGALVDATFTSVTAISEELAVVCTDSGHLCRLDLSRGGVELTTIEQTETTISAVSYRPETAALLWADGSGSLHERQLRTTSSEHAAMKSAHGTGDSRNSRTRARPSLLRQSLGLSSPKQVSTVAIGCLLNKTVCIDADGVVRAWRVGSSNLKEDISAVGSHNGLVQGVQKLPREANLGLFYTWSRNGEIRFWDSGGHLTRCEVIDSGDIVDIEGAASNEFKVVCYARANDIFLAGDQYGVIRAIGAASWDSLQTLRAHSAEINSIDIHSASSTMATCSRDRTVQVFMLHDNGAELLQTCDDHISSVSQVSFNQNGKRLLSCSVDRTVVIRERIERELERGTASAFILARTVTLKAAPLSMNFMPAAADVLVISTMDRYVMKIDVATGTTLTSFKATDRDSDDTVTLNTIRLGRASPADDGCILAGYSAIDKSIRLYDLEKGILLGRDSGHTEGISDLLVLGDDLVEKCPSDLTLVTTGLDGTIMIWSATMLSGPILTPQQELTQSQAFCTDPEKTSDRPSPASLPPLRKILSKMDIADFSRQHSPTREVSPVSLRRKTSRLALATSIEEADESIVSDTRGSRLQNKKSEHEKRSPSPQRYTLARPRKQRSSSEMSKVADTRTTNSRRSPSPSDLSSAALSSTKNNTRANNSRIRRPPSVPNELNIQAASQERIQSLNLGNDFGSIGMATDQTCRMLRTYGKKLNASRGDLDLDGIEADLEAVLKLVRLKKARTDNVPEGAQMRTMKGNIEDEVKGLSLLMEKTSVS